MSILFYKKKIFRLYLSFCTICKKIHYAECHKQTPASTYAKNRTRIPVSGFLLLVLFIIVVHLFRPHRSPGLPKFHVPEQRRKSGDLL